MGEKSKNQRQNQTVIVHLYVRFFSSPIYIYGVDSVLMLL